jgi:hypothetical protein
MTNKLQLRRHKKRLPAMLLSQDILAGTLTNAAETVDGNINLLALSHHLGARGPLHQKHQHDFNTCI